MKKIICALLVLSVLISFASCVKDSSDVEKTDREITLKVESVDAVYSDELCASASSALTDAAEKIIYKKEKLKLSESEKSELCEYISSSFIPLLKELPVYANELTELCDYALYFADNCETLSMLSVYTTLVSLLGNERNASLCYELIAIYLTHIRDDYMAKYAQTNYPWHLREGEKCDALLKNLTENLGKEKFSMSFDFSIACIAFMSGMLLSESSESTAFKISAPELNMLLLRHSKHLAKNSLSDEEWGVSFSIVEYVADTKLTFDSPVKNAVTSALIDESFFSSVSVAANEFINLYESFSLALTDECCDSFINGSSEDVCLAVCKTLALCRDELSAFLNAFESCALPDASIGLSELTAAGYGDA